MSLKYLLTFANHHGEDRTPETITLPNKLFGNARVKFINRAVDAGIDKAIVKDILKTVGYDFVTNRGKLHKRFCSEAYKRGFVIGDEHKQELGTIIGDCQKNAEHPAAIEFTHNFWWGADDFSQESSCWWGSFRAAKDMLLNAGGFGMVEYKQRKVGEKAVSRFDYEVYKTFPRGTSGDRYGIYKLFDVLDAGKKTIQVGSLDYIHALCNILNSNSELVLVPKYDDKFGRVWVMPWESRVPFADTHFDAQYFVLFNAYGRFLADYAEILAAKMSELTGAEWGVKRCGADNCGSPRGTFWINNDKDGSPGKGYVVAPLMYIEHLPTKIDFLIGEESNDDDEHDEDGVYCEDTGNYVHEDEAYWCERGHFNCENYAEVRVDRYGSGWRSQIWAETTADEHATEVNGIYYDNDIVNDYFREVDGTWYDADEVVYSEIYNEDILCCCASQAYPLNGRYDTYVSDDDTDYVDVEGEDIRYHIDDDRICEIDGTYYLTTADDVVEVDEEWYLVDSDKIVEVDGDYYRTDSDDVVEIDSAYYLTDGDEVVEVDGNWYLVDSGLVAQNEDGEWELVQETIFSTDETLELA